MNSPKIGRILAQWVREHGIPSRAEIPDPVRAWHGEKEIVWEHPSGVTIRTHRHTMGRVFADIYMGDEYFGVFASNHKAAVRRLFTHAKEFYS